MSEERVVGIDAGGTSVRIVVADAITGQRLAETHASAREDGLPALDEPLREALTSARSDVAAIRSVCAGITKITRTGRAEAWEQVLAGLFPQARVEVVPDFVIALWGAVGGAGIVVIAGTGSVVYGEDTVGNSVRVGGRGWEYGDEGSGAAITTDLLRRTLRALDGMADSTALTEAVCEHLQTRDPADLAERARRRAEGEGRGFLVPLVLQRAQAGDSDAANLFVGAAGWLALHVRAAATLLGFGNEAFTVATVGGLWEAGNLILQPFSQVLERWLPQGRVVAPLAPPGIGAARRAAHLLQQGTRR